HQRGARVPAEVLVRREEMRARDRCAQALPRRIRRQVAGAAAPAGARLDFARGRLVPLPSAHARPQGGANRLLSPHRIFAAGSGVSAAQAAAQQARYLGFEAPSVWGQGGLYSIPYLNVIAKPLS